LRKIVIKTGATGSIVRLKDVARVELGASDYSQYVYTDGQEPWASASSSFPARNPLHGRCVYARLKELRRNFPPDLEYSIRMTRLFSSVIHPRSDLDAT